MIKIPVSSLMTEAALSVSPETPIVEAAHHLRQPDVPAVIVCDTTKTVVGVVTESDIVAVVAERGGNRPLESVMSSPVVTTAPSTPIRLAADRMRDEGITLLAVVVDDNIYKGLITRDTLAPYLSRHRLEINWKGDPLSLDGTDTPDTVAAERS